MKGIAKKQWLGLVAPLVLVVFQAAADDSAKFSADDNFQHGWHEASFGAVDFTSDLVRTQNRPNVDYALGYAQVGFMVTHPAGGNFFRGSFELAPEFFGADIYQGPGSYIAGGTLWLRYNFVPAGWRLVPYLQGGGGGTSMDIPHGYDGKSFNFNLDFGLGCHYFISRRCSLNLEYRLQHISNANLWAHNIGINSTGAALGVSFFF